MGCTYSTGHSPNVLIVWASTMVIVWLTLPEKDNAVLKVFFLFLLDHLSSSRADFLGRLLPNMILAPFSEKVQNNLNYLIFFFSYVSLGKWVIIESKLIEWLSKLDPGIYWWSILNMILSTGVWHWCCMTQEFQWHVEHFSILIEIWSDWVYLKKCFLLEIDWKKASIQWLLMFDGNL